MIGNNCTGLEARSPFPTMTAPGEIPQGWKAAPRAQSYVYDNLLSCDRVKLGSFERPLLMVFDTADNAVPPPACDGPAVTTEIVHAIMVNDTAVASWLHDRYHLPAYAGTGHASAASAALVLGSHDWRWTITNGTGTNRLSMNSTETDVIPFEAAIRYAWPNGQGISYMQWNYTFKFPGHEFDPTTGQLYSPLLYATARPNPYVGEAQALYEINFDGRIHEFKDFQCEQPLA
ncbi:MAG: hypothetical protein V4510_00675 [bacterium]